MDTTRPKETKVDLIPCAPLHDALLPLNPILRPTFSIRYCPSTGLILSGTIAGLAQWYEEDKLQDQEPDWFGIAIPANLAEITHLHMARVHHVIPSADTYEAFFEAACDLRTMPDVDFQAETVLWQLSPEQCKELLDAIGADTSSYDPDRAAQPAFPPI